MKTAKPLLISFEGIDGSGKSTQCKMLYHELLDRGYGVHLYREPGGTAISEKIRDILLDRENDEMSPITEMLLYFSSRNQLITEKVLPALERGEIVLLDRFVDSTIAYQGYGRDLSLESIRKVAEVAIGDLSPDLTILVDTPLDTAENRMDNRELDRLEAENVDFKTRTRNGYLQLVKDEPNRFLLLDGRESIETLKGAVIERVDQILEPTT
ncbi:MAG: dTMP kinase [Candidatus Marinimicrobia bacterium]|jgi:dTMP kinase|nr:dTMP kinase [Candidatus Neomarinimicrobiota bacterium]MBT4359757.1 dTMP kinase [Candidatus Neomarinimicrobiota bacterium]MBT4714627.1 dTMP kinase [Candidatus Neomarinimicrobiota bacterium]MBT4945178.1 dTMP kinase [Candidatus Neomarinimicrobiota bacterium]MBT5269932.1 dTMP kinase [Candidatus Neomarinimicrobiota bacterium]